MDALGQNRSAFISLKGMIEKQQLGNRQEYRQI